MSVSQEELEGLNEDQLNQLAEDKGVNPEDYDSPEDLAGALADRVSPEELLAARGGSQSDSDESDSDQ